MADIALIDYGAGNIPSVLRALEVALINESKMFEIIVTDDPDLVRSADRIVIPGVGHFRDCQEGLLRPEGMEDALTNAGVDSLVYAGSDIVQELEDAYRALEAKGEAQ